MAKKEINANISVNIPDAIEIVIAAIHARIVPFIEGSPGIGKSAIGHFIANKFNLKMIDIRLSQCDPTDLSGFPSIQGNHATYVPMDTFPLEGDPLPLKEDGTQYAGWLIFFDELSSANRAVQAAAYKVILDRMIGQKPLNSKCAVIAAGNSITDNAIVEEMSTALQSRMTHIHLEVNADQWLEYALSNGYDHRITSYVAFNNNALYTFRPDHTDKTYACPRTWEFLNRLMKDVGTNSKLALPLYAGTIGKGTAIEFIHFCEIYTDLPSYKDVVTNPHGFKLSDEPSVIYALTGAMASHFEGKDIAPFLQFIDRMPAEFKLMTL